MLIMGARGGIGAGLYDLLRSSSKVERLIGTSRQGKDGLEALDITDPHELAEFAQCCMALGPFHIILNATGLLHDGALQPEKRLADLDVSNMRRVFDVNTIAPALIYQLFSPLLPRQGKSVLAQFSARVGSISDNRIGGWYSYRAAKAAQNMITRTAAIEIARRYKEAILVGLHPGTVDTPLSAPFQGGTARENLFSPDVSAGKLLRVIDSLTAQDSGYVFAYDGTRVPF